MFRDDDIKPNYDDIKQLTYLDRVYKESLRLYSPQNVTFREAKEDVTLSIINFFF